jgi:hypothetical protein
MSTPIKILQVEDQILLNGADITTLLSNLSTSLSTLSSTDASLQNQINGINLILQSDNINLDTVQELVDALETLQTSFSTLLVNDLTTGGTTKALTAQQGVVLKGLIDSLTAVVSGKANSSDVYTKTQSDANYEPKNSNIQSHISNTSNPHSVTKSQVGLGNVDNTSDADKPVSTAQAVAIGLKEDSSNKSTSTADSASTTKFPVWSVIVSYFDVTRIKTILGITTLSGSNTGDETTASIQSKRPLKTVNGNSLEGTGDISISGGGSDLTYYAKRLTAIQSTSGLGLTTLNGFGFTIPPGQSMTIFGVLIFTAAATTTGINYGINVLQETGANGNAVGSYSADVTLSSSPAATALQDGDVINVAQNSNVNYTILGTASTAGNNSAKFMAQITNLSTNGSTFVNFVFASEVAGSSVSVQINSVATALIGTSN